MNLKKLASLPQDIADRFDVSDTLPGEAKLTLSGGKRVFIENHRGVLEYSEDRIVVSFLKAKITVTGTKLVIAAMNNRELLIAGRVQSVEWE